MESYKEFFAGKRITVMGLGLLGRGVGDVAFLANAGAQLTVTDMKTPKQLADSLAQLTQYPNITYHLGGHIQNDFTDTDMVIKAAGVRLDSPHIAVATAANVPVYMSTAIAAKFAMEMGAQVIGITGTRGKSTVTQMLYWSLTESHDPGTIHLGGNVRGISTLALLPHIKKDDILVLELDSWQLQGFGDLCISPNIAVFTNLMPDHQNYYKDTDEYFADKAKIFKYQKEGDLLVVGPSIVDRVRAAHPPVSPVVPDPLLPGWHLMIVGEHNRENAALARAALESLEEERGIWASLTSFTGVEGRLQLVSDINGVKIYNDNNATTPDATIAALKALDTGKKNIILICGGADKGLDMSRMLYEIAKICKRVICLAGTGTSRIIPLMADYSLYDNLVDAVHEAVRSAIPGDIILFSPAFASFGIFINEYDRNDQFVKIVKNL